ncbi:MULTISPECIES: MerR family transcriptional regulator [unclassified Nonomuraea]|uniref:MerR family transcriptional regulator n=1 Tax=unclassified Nonomuraea TaxID=2593643 RepID=UPI00340386BC
MSTLITTGDAAAIYCIPARTIRRWHAEGRLTDPLVDRGRYLWNRGEIDQLARLRSGHRLRPAPK